MSFQKSIKKTLERATYDKKQFHRQILNIAFSAKEMEQTLNEISNKISLNSSFKKKLK